MYRATIIWLAWILLAWPNEAPAASPDAVAAVAATGDLVIAPGTEIQLRVTPGDTIEVAWNGGPLLPMQPPLRAPASGSHWLALASRDRVGNPSTVRWTRVLVDDQPPTVVLTTEPPAVTNGDRSWIPPNAIAVAEAEDELGGLGRLEIHLGQSMQGGDQSSFKRALPATEGPVHPVARAIDRVGLTTEASLALHVDAAPPQGKFHITGPHIAAALHLLAPSARIEAQIDDNESGLANSTTWINGRQASVELLAGPWNPGEYQVQVVATDRVGNEGQIGPLSFVVDGSGPILHWRLQGESVVDEEGRRIYRPPVELEVSAEDAPAGLANLELSLDDALFEPLESPVTLHQEHVVLRATDRLGQTTTETATWRLDGEAPEYRLRTGGMDIAPGALSIKIGEELRPVVHHEVAGIRHASYRFVHGFPLRRVEGESRQLPKVFSFPATGDWRLIIDATDRLGNTSSSQWDIVVTKEKD